MGINYKIIVMDEMDWEYTGYSFETHFLPAVERVFNVNLSDDDWSHHGGIAIIEIGKVYPSEKAISELKKEGGIFDTLFTQADWRPRFEDQYNYMGVK